MTSDKIMRDFRAGLSAGELRSRLWDKHHIDIGLASVLTRLASKVIKSNEVDTHVIVNLR